MTPLAWDLPLTFTAIDTSDGPRRATFKVPRAGADAEDAELQVWFFGTGALGDPKKNEATWFGEFDGDVGAKAERSSLAAAGGSIAIDTAEVAGTYKFAMGPKVGKQKKSPVQMVKNDWRMIVATIRTKDRGNWFFRLAGPSETVLAAKGSLRTMLESVR